VASDIEYYRGRLNGAGAEVSGGGTQRMVNENVMMQALASVFRLSSDLPIF
jgi:hypothetical protein